MIGIKEGRKATIHEFGALAIENVMKCSFFRRTLDNITVVLIGFSNLKRNLNVVKEKEQEGNANFGRKA